MTHRPGLDANAAHSARMYDYYLGGKDNYPVDQQAADAVKLVFPHIEYAARTNRAFMVRAVRYLAEQGVDQFLDIGTGLPTEPNLHQVVQSVVPRARVLYVDNDPIVLTHARALLTSTPAGRTAYLDADLTRPESILNAPELSATLDLSRPVALSLIAILHFIGDHHRPYELVNTLLSAFAEGSYVLITHATGDFDPKGTAAAAEVYRNRGIEVRTRTRDEIARFFTGLDLIEPNITPPHRWHPAEPEPELRLTSTERSEPSTGTSFRDKRVSFYSAVARVPARTAGQRPGEQAQQ
ncbi:SAM-dependent methyltransferase [Nocardia sp. NPDC057227]|uniref:SAM-dependent methyltransferase n=1 Tax=Nocardia sp. NPDC057227 TaxID=3346056 RepID=UPI00362BFE1F